MRPGLVAVFPWYIEDKVKLQLSKLSNKNTSNTSSLLLILRYVHSNDVIITQLPKRNCMHIWWHDDNNAYIKKIFRKARETKIKAFILNSCLATSKYFPYAKSWSLYFTGAEDWLYGALKAHIPINTWPQYTLLIHL